MRSSLLHSTQKAVKKTTLFKVLNLILYWYLIFIFSLTSIGALSLGVMLSLSFKVFLGGRYTAHFFLEINREQTIYHLWYLQCLGPILASSQASGPKTALQSTLIFELCFWKGLIPVEKMHWAIQSSLNVKLSVFSREVMDRRFKAVSLILSEGIPSVVPCTKHVSTHDC